MIVSLTPRAASQDRPGGLEVDAVISAGDGPLELRLDSLAPGLERVRDKITAIDARDALGNLELAPSGAQSRGQYQIWTARRPVAGPVRLRYFMPSALAHPERRGPHIDLQAIDGGVSGSFAGFLLAPPGRLHIKVHWHLPPEQRAVASAGDSDFEVEGSQAELGNTLFAAGPLQTIPATLPPNGFGVARLGGTAVNLGVAAHWYAKAFVIERDAFRASAQTRFRVLVRNYDGGPIASGRATKGAFLYYLPPHADAAAIEHRSTIAHELVHSLANALDDEQGEEGTWYTEGIADYVMLALPYRAGLYTPREYLNLVNAEVAGYYTNALRATPNTGLGAVMWSGRNAWMLPYGRGALYFADLDAKLRARGTRLTVIDLINAMSQRFRAGAPQTDATWRSLLADRVGAWAVADWQAMLAGTLLVPVNDAFGACFIRRPVVSGDFDLGFAQPTAVHAAKIIGGVRPGGPAYRAGLRDGDVIAADVDINPFAQAYHRPITLTVQRNGRLRSVTYDPHSGAAVGWQWMPRSGNADAPCGHGADIGKASRTTRRR